MHTVRRFRPLGALGLATAAAVSSLTLATPPALADGGATQATATPVSLGLTHGVPGTLHGADPVQQWYRVTVPAAGTYVATVYDAAGGASMPGAVWGDYALTVLDPSGKPLVDTSGSGQVGPLVAVVREFTAAAAGTYYLRVTPDTASPDVADAGRFMLRVQQSSLVAPQFAADGEPNSVATLAQPVVVGETMSGALQEAPETTQDAGPDVDYLRFRAVKDTAYTVSVTGDANSDLGGQMDVPGAKAKGLTKSSTSAGVRLTATVTATANGWATIRLGHTGFNTGGPSYYRIGYTTCVAVQGQSCRRSASLAQGDTDGDGTPDLLGLTSSGFQVARSLTSTQLSLPHAVAGNSSDTTWMQRVPSRNGDRYTDLLSRTSDGRMWFHPGTAAGFGTRVQVGSGWNGMRLVQAVGDVTGDGRTDLLAVDSAGLLRLYWATDTTYHLAGGTQVGRGWGSMQHLLGLGRINGDDVPDLAAIDSGGNLWAYYLRRTGQTSSYTQIGHGWGGFAVATPGDLDADGRTDIIGLRSDGTTWNYLNRGGGRFTATRSGSSFQAFRLIA